MTDLIDILFNRSRDNRYTFYRIREDNIMENNTKTIWIWYDQKIPNPNIFLPWTC